MVATTLAAQATPRPMAINVNMLRLRVAIDCAPRTKNGQPAHSTTGVAKASCTQFETCGDSGCQRKKCPPISRATTGAASSAAIQSRRVMSISSTFGPALAVGISGSSPMPQIGQAPGPCWRTSGCIGQVNIASAAIGAVGLRAAGSRYVAGVAANLVRQPPEQKKYVVP